MHYFMLNYKEKSIELLKPIAEVETTGRGTMHICKRIQRDRKHRRGEENVPISSDEWKHRGNECAAVFVILYAILLIVLHIFHLCRMFISFLFGLIACYYNILFICVVCLILIEMITQYYCGINLVYFTDFIMIIISG